MTRPFSSDPAAKFDWRFDFSNNAYFKDSSVASGKCRKVTGLNINLRTYKIKEGGRARQIDIPVGIEPITVTFEGILINGNDGSKFMNEYYKFLDTHGTTGVLYSNWIGGVFGKATGYGLYCDLRRMRPDEYSKWREPAFGGIIDRHLERVVLLDGFVKQFVPADEISASNDVAVERIVATFNEIDFGGARIFVP